MFKNKKIYIIFLIIIFLLKTSSFIDNSILFKRIQPDAGYSSGSIIKAGGDCSSIEVSQQNKRFWVGPLNYIPPVFPFVKHAVQSVLCFLLFFFLIIDLKSYILKLISVYFNGSKYKEDNLLSTF